VNAIAPAQPAPATPNPFAALWALGYRRLCPVIPPEAPISPSSGLYKRIGTSSDGRGKMPGLKNPDGTWSGFRDWQSHPTIESDCRRWSKMGAGVGIRTGDGLVAIDADTLNRQFARLIAEKIEELFGVLPPIRFGRAPKAIYLVRLKDGERFRYRKFHFGPEIDGKRELVEILTEGRQFVAEGVHPVTKQPYRWPNGLPAFVELPVVSVDQLERLVAELRKILPDPGPIAAGGGGGGVEVDQATLEGDADLVKAAVNALPNPHSRFSSRESYLAVGYAIKAALPRAGDLAFELFESWCEKWDGGVNDPEVIRADWERMKPPFRRGADWLFEQVRQATVGAPGGPFNARAQKFFEQPPDDQPLFGTTAGERADSTDRPTRASGRRGGVGGVVELLNAAEIKPEAVNWLWPRWIARKKIHLIAGAPGAGKTTIALNIGAIISKAGSHLRRWPDGSECIDGGKVVIWSGEDSVADTLIPRLMAAGADLSRISIVGDVRENDGSRRPFDPSIDFLKLKSSIENGDVALLIIDPIVSAVSGNSNLASDVRRNLTPLFNLVNESDIAVIGITHFGKGTNGKNPLDRVLGSQAFGAVGRAVLVAGVAPNTEGAAPRRILARAKTNIGEPGGGIAYELAGGNLPETGIRTLFLEWRETLEGSAQALLDEVEGTEREGREKEAENLLREVLRDGPKPMREVEVAAKAHGIGLRTLQTAKAALRIYCWKADGKNAPWMWSLTHKLIEPNELA
jgi:hypothetical protein